MKSDCVLVAGGAGYIGSHAVLALLEAGRRVVVVDDFSTGRRELLQPGAVLEEGDLGDPVLLTRLFRHYPIGAVMHFAAFSIVPESVRDPLKYWSNNVRRSLALIEAMRTAGCDRFILSSTAAVYGEPERVPIVEEQTARPGNPYGQTKLALERCLADLAAAGILRYCALRYFNAAGADPGLRAGEMHEPETHLIPIVLQSAAGRRGPVTIHGADYPTPDGSCIRDYVHVSDLARAHLLALDHLERGGAGGPFNLGNGSGASVRQVIDVARAVTGRPVTVVEGPRRPGDPAVLVASSARAGTDLGWQPEISSLERIVETAWDWMTKGATGR